MPFVFDTAPQRIYWELTRACDLACLHCRANANPCADERELNTSEVFRILGQLAAEAKPSVVLTGGDPRTRVEAYLRQL